MAIHVPLWRYGLAYGLCLVSFAAGLACAALIHNTYFFLAAGLQWGPRMVRASNQAVVLGLGIALLLLLIICESYYRIGAVRGRLWARFLRVTVLQLVLLAGVHLLRLGVMLADGAVSWLLIGFIICELTAAIACWRLYRRLESARPYTP